MSNTHAGRGYRRVRDAKPLAAALVLAAALLSAVPPASIAEAEDDLPRLGNGRPDFSGIWQTTSAADYDLEPHTHRQDAPPGPGVIEGHFIPYLPSALAQRKKNFENRATGDPAVKGFTLGVPRGIYYPEPFQIFQRERDLIIVHQFGHSVRTVHTNGTQHPDDLYDLWMGDSRGNWDGDTLVVDITGFNGRTWLDRSGNYHTDQLHVVERWRFLDKNTIEYTATLEDPQVYSRPWTLGVILHRHREKNFQLIEDYRYTLDYAEFYPPRPDQ